MLTSPTTSADKLAAQRTLAAARGGVTIRATKNKVRQARKTMIGHLLGHSPTLIEKCQFFRPIFLLLAEREGFELPAVRGRYSSPSAKLGNRRVSHFEPKHQRKHADGPANCYPADYPNGIGGSFSIRFFGISH